MWYTLRKSPDVDPDFVRSATDLLRSTSRNLILVTGGVYLAWHVVATLTWPQTMGPSVWLITPVVALVCALAYWLLPRQFLAAQAIWQVGLAAAITMAVYVFQRPQIAFFYALLPLMAVVVLGWRASLLAEGLVIALVWWLSHSRIVSPLPLVTVWRSALAGLSRGCWAGPQRIRCLP